MIDVSHDRYHRRTGFHVRFGVDDCLFQIRLGIVALGSLRHVAQLTHQNHRGFLIEYLVDGDHRAHFHHDLDDLGRLHRHFLRELTDRDGFRHHHFANDRLGRCLKITCLVVFMAVFATAAAPAIAPTAGVATGFDAATFGQIVSPGTCGLDGFLDRFLVGFCFFFTGFQHWLVQRALAGRRIFLQHHSLANARAIFGRCVCRRRSLRRVCCSRCHATFGGALGRFFLARVGRLGNGGWRFLSNFLVFFAAAFRRRFGFLFGLLGQQRGLPLFFTAALGQFDFVQNRLRRLDRQHRLNHLGLFDLHKRALFANFNLNRARLTGRVGLLDFSDRLARERDFFLFFGVTVSLLQIGQQMRLVIFRKAIGRNLGRDAGRLQLDKQKLLRELKLLGKLCDGG